MATEKTTTVAKKEKPLAIPGKKTKEELRGLAKLPPKVHKPVTPTPAATPAPATTTAKTPAQLQADADMAKAEAERHAAYKA